jgi:hypothetical protein
MAYDRYDTRGAPRDERWRWSSDRGRDQDRGFFERAGDEVASWFGDDEAERRREHDRRMDERERGFGGGRFGRDREPSSDRERSSDRGDYWRDRTWSSSEFGRDRDDDSGFLSGRGYRGTSGESGRHGSMWTTGREEPSQYRPMAGDYSRSEGFFAASGTRDQGDIARSRTMDPHYHAWRRRQIDELDRDYEDYRRENQARFEDDFSNWREQRMQKRSLLGKVREHMEVVGSDDDHVGTVDCIVGDRVILTKSDPESGGLHHSLSCSDIDRVDGDRVVLDLPAEQAKQRWREESRNRAMFEREDQGGPHMLNRSFEGTYR